MGELVQVEYDVVIDEDPYQPGLTLIYTALDGQQERHFISSYLLTVAFGESGLRERILRKEAVLEIAANETRLT